MGPCDERPERTADGNDDDRVRCTRTVGPRNQGGWADHVALRRRDGLPNAEGGLTFATPSPAAVISMWGCCATPTTIAMPTVSPTRWPIAMRVREGLVPTAVPLDLTRNLLVRNWSRGLGRRFVSRTLGACKVGQLCSSFGFCGVDPHCSPETGEATEAANPCQCVGVRTRSASDTTTLG